MFSLICFIFHLYEYYPDSIYLFQFLFIFFGIYTRFRNKMLGEESLKLAGVNIQQGTVTWEQVLYAVNFQLLRWQQNSSIFLTPSAGGPTSALETAQSLTNPLSSDEAHIIQNRWPQRNKIVFPFFFDTARRHVSFRSAFKTMYDTLRHSYQKAPADTISLVSTAAGACGGGVYMVARDQQTRALEVEKVTIANKDAATAQEKVAIIKEVFKVTTAKERVEVYQKNKELYLEEAQRIQERIDRASKTSQIDPSDVEKLARVKQNLSETTQLLKKSTADYEAISSQSLYPSANLLASSRSFFGVSGLLEKKNVALLENGDSIGPIGVIQTMVDVFDSI
jgi:hypothetical protein